MIKRGDVFYIHYESVCGSEQSAGRPAVVVSRNAINSSSPVVEVVYLTTREKNPSATHVEITSTDRKSTALCEQVANVSTSRFGDFKCRLSEEEMEKIDKGIAFALGLDIPQSRTEASIHELSAMLDLVKNWPLEEKYDMLKEMFVSFLMAA